MRIIIYFSILFAVLLLHAGLILFAYISIIPTITASLGLVILGLLFYEIYKKYKYTNFAKYLLIVFIVIWGLLVFSQIEYIPAKQIIVTDVFGKPLENISVGIQDYVGDSFSIGGGNAEYRFPKDFYYITNKNGQVITKSRFYFGERKTVFIYMPINHYIFGGLDIVDKLRNESFDGKSLEVYKEKNLQIALAPIMEDYRKCNSIADKNRKNECLVYSLFYTAVKEKNPELCKLYNNEAIKNALNGKHFFYLSREDEIKNQCLMLVGGIINNKPEICNEIKNIESREYNNQCKCLFNSQYCEGEDNFKKEFDLLRSLFTKDTHNYLCEGKTKRDDGQIVYKNSQIIYLDTASDLYRKMFCN